MPRDVEIIQFLEERDALSLGDSPWPTATDQDQLTPIDYDSMFPSGSDLIDDDPLLDSLPDDLLALGDDLLSTGDAFGRSLGAAEDQTAEGGNTFDFLAWYQPIHFFGPDWGIFIKQEAIIDLAKEIGRFYPTSLFRLATRRGGGFRTSDPRRLAAALVRATFSLLFLHEHYHHKTESFSIRLHVVENADRFIRYHHNVYEPNLGTSNQLEESLANADAYRRLSQPPYSRAMGPVVLDATKRFAREMFKSSPPGYSEALNYLTAPTFADGEGLLQGRIQAGTLQGGSRPSGWNLATHMTQSLFPVTSNIWEIVPTGGRPITSSGPVAPLSRPTTGDVDKLLKSHGYMEDRGRGKGSHRYYVKPRSAPVCLPNGRERLSFTVLRQVANALGIGNLNALQLAISST